MYTTKLNNHLILNDYRLNLIELQKHLWYRFNIYLTYSGLIERLFNDYQYIRNNKLDIILNKPVLSNYVIGQQYIYLDEIKVTFLGCLNIKYEPCDIKDTIFNSILCLFAVHNDISNNFTIMDLPKCKRLISYENR